MISSDGHAPGVIPGVPVLTDTDALLLVTTCSEHGLEFCQAGDRLRRKRLMRKPHRGVAYWITTLGLKALAAHRLGLATRASFTIRNGDA